MDRLLNNFEDILKNIKKCKKYSTSAQYLSGNIFINIIKILLLKKSNKALKNINISINEINKDIKVMKLGYELKIFIYREDSTIIYDKNQVNVLVYNQLKELLMYLYELEQKIYEIKEKVYKSSDL